jgi:hypothetical protein
MKETIDYLDVDEQVKRENEKLQHLLTAYTEIANIITTQADHGNHLSYNKLASLFKTRPGLRVGIAPKIGELLATPHYPEEFSGEPIYEMYKPTTPPFLAKILNVQLVRGSLGLSAFTKKEAGYYLELPDLNIENIDMNIIAIP